MRRTRRGTCATQVPKSTQEHKETLRPRERRENSCSQIGHSNPSPAPGERVLENRNGSFENSLSAENSCSIYDTGASTRSIVQASEYSKIVVKDPETSRSCPLLRRRTRHTSPRSTCVLRGELVVPLLYTRGPESMLAPHGSVWEGGP